MRIFELPLDPALADPEAVEEYLAPLTGADAGVSVSNVTFEPGCRNNWHVHHVGGQILLVTGGRGYYQEWGPARARAQAGRCGEHPARNRSIGTGRRRTAGSRTWPSPCRPKARRTRGGGPVADEEYAALA